MDAEWLKKLGRLTDIDQLFERFEVFWKEQLKNQRPTEYEPYLQNQFLFDELARDPNVFIGVFEHKSLGLVYFSNNVEEVFGFTKEEYSRQKMRFIFEVISLEHILFMFQVLWLGIKSLNSMPLQKRQEHLVVQYCGLKLKHRTKESIRLFIRQFPIKLDEKGHPALSIIMVEDITHLLKDQFYWTRIEAGKSRNLVHWFRSGDLKLTETDILSTREIEVLRLLALDLSSEDIAEKLFISIHTVEKHRKNMLNRTGAKNTTALLHVARLCRLL